MMLRSTDEIDDSIARRAKTQQPRLGDSFFTAMELGLYEHEHVFTTYTRSERSCVRALRQQHKALLCTQLWLHCLKKKTTHASARLGNHGKMNPSVDLQFQESRVAGPLAIRTAEEQTAARAIAATQTVTVAAKRGPEPSIL